MAKIKEDIIRELSLALSLDKSKAKNLIEKLLQLVKDNLSEGNDLLISGFGEFRIRRKNARMGRNPKTLQQYEISERTVVTFHSSKVFRGELNRE